MALESVSIKLVKILFFFFNLLFWLSGATLIAVGAVIRQRYAAYFAFDEYKFALTEFFIMVVGMLIFVIAFLGCCGALRENLCMLTCFVVMLSIVFMLEIASSVFGFAYRKKIKEITVESLENATQGYHQHHDMQILLDKVQSTFNCCGSFSPTEYNLKKGNLTYSSCGEKGQAVASCHVGMDCYAKLYTIGCHQKFSGFMRKRLYIVGAVSIGVAMIQVAAIVLASLLMSLSKQSSYKTLEVVS